MMGKWGRLYFVLRSICILAAEAVELSAGASADEAVTLQCLVILNVLLELAEGIRPRRAFGATEERHGGGLDIAQV